MSEINKNIKTIGTIQQIQKTLNKKKSSKRKVTANSQNYNKTNKSNKSNNSNNNEITFKSNLLSLDNITNTSTSAKKAKTNIYLHSNNISDDEIKEIYEQNEYKDLITLIKNKDLVNFEVYQRNIFFKPIGQFASRSNPDIKHSSPKVRRSTRAIDFYRSSEITKKEFTESGDWLYIICINNNIIKIGGTHVGLKNRMNGYLKGHNGKKNISKFKNDTNTKLYATMEFYLELGCSVEVYGYNLNERMIKHYVRLFGETFPIDEQIYHVYEGVFFADFFRKYKKYPVLGKYADKKYKNFKGLSNKNKAHVKAVFTHLTTPTQKIIQIPAERFTNKRKKIQTKTPLKQPLLFNNNGNNNGNKKN